MKNLFVGMGVQATLVVAYLVLTFVAAKPIVVGYVAVGVIAGTALLSVGNWLLWGMKALRPKHLPVFAGLLLAAGLAKAGVPLHMIFLSPIVVVAGLSILCWIGMAAKAISRRKNLCLS